MICVLMKYWFGVHKCTIKDRHECYPPHEWHKSLHNKQLLGFGILLSCVHMEIGWKEERDRGKKWLM